MTKFSLLCPSRERTYSLERLLNSLLTTTRTLSEVEILFAVDNDDVTTKNYFETIIRERKYSQINIKIHYRERSQFLNRDYYNFLASKAEGEFLWIIGDDVVFQVCNWDERIYAKLNDYLKDKKDRIICAGIRDNTPKPKPSLPQFPCFPLFTKEAFQYWGFTLHSNIPTWGADYLIYLLYNGANRYLAINDEIYLLHIGIHTHTGPKDTTSQNIENIFNRLKMAPEHNVDLAKENLIPKQVEQFRSYLNSVNK